MVGLDSGGDGPSLGDLVGAALWGGSLYFCSPLQLLLLFIGARNKVGSNQILRYR